MTCISQNAIKISLYSYTSDYLAGEYNHEGVIGFVKKITSDFIQLDRVMNFEAKKIKYGHNSWAIRYNDTLYVNLSSFPATNSRSNKFVKINYETDNVLMLLPESDSKKFYKKRLPIGYYPGGGLVGASITYSTKSIADYYWKGEEGGVYQINVLPLSQLRSEELPEFYRAEFKIFGKSSYDKIRKKNGQGKLIRKVLRDYKYEDIVKFLKEYYK